MQIEAGKFMLSKSINLKKKHVITSYRIIYIE